MEKEHVSQFLSMHTNKFASESLPMVKRKLESLPEERFEEICAINFKNPTTILLFAILLGGFGVDRFVLGQTGMGVLKLLTLGGCGIFVLIDIISASSRAKEYNLRMFNMAI